MELIDLESAARLQVTPNQAALDAIRPEPIAPGRSAVEKVCEAEQIPLITLQTDWPFDSVVLGCWHGEEWWDERYAASGAARLLALAGIPLVILFHMRHTTPIARTGSHLAFLEAGDAGAYCRGAFSRTAVFAAAAVTAAGGGRARVGAGSARGDGCLGVV